MIDKQHSAVHFSLQSHPAQSEPSVLLPADSFYFFLICLSRHVNGEADGLAF